MKDMKTLDPSKGNFPCRNIAIEIDYPKSKGDIETFLFFLYHEGIEVFVGKQGGWFITMKGDCKYLQGNRCAAGENQSEVCTQHGSEPKNIDAVARHRFRDERDLLKYLKEHRPALYRRLNPMLIRSAMRSSRPRPSSRGPHKSTILDPKHQCTFCDLCCTYINIVVQKPKTDADVRELLMYIARENCDLNRDEDGGWSLHFHSKCAKLGRNGLCSEYETRPTICKTFSSNSCHGIDFKESVIAHFPTGKSLVSYIKTKFPGTHRKLNNKLKQFANKQ